MKSNEWKSLPDFFKALNENESYVVLRNYEDFKDGKFSSEHPDIDILCSDANQVIKTMCSQSRSINNSDKVHRLVKINGQAIAVDVREVGDGYYDKSWEKKMLVSRKMENNLCFILNEENYFYSLLYHCIVQKKYISNDYIKKLYDLANKTGVSFDIKNRISCLEDYMRRSGYRYTYPKSPWTTFNTVGVDKSLVDFNFTRHITRKAAEVYKKIR